MGLGAEKALPAMFRHSAGSLYQVYLFAGSPGSDHSHVCIEDGGSDVGSSDRSSDYDSEANDSDLEDEWQPWAPHHMMLFGMDPGLEHISDEEEEPWSDDDDDGWAPDPLGLNIQQQ